MNENIDLTKILKDCPKGTKFYSSIYGDLLYSCMHLRLAVQKITFTKPNSISSVDYYRDGKYCQGQGECTIFPSKDQRDWSKFTAPWYKREKLIEPKFKVGDKIRHKDTNKDDVYEITKVYDDSYGINGFTWIIYMKYQDQYELVPNKFDPKTLKAFDKVLVRDNHYQNWTCGFFSYIVIFDDAYKYNVGEILYKMCIPYNDDTKYLVGTRDKAPDFYRYWED